MHSTDNHGHLDHYIVNGLLDTLEIGDYVCSNNEDSPELNHIRLELAVQAQQLLIQHFDNKYGEVPQRTRTRNARY